MHSLPILNPENKISPHLSNFKHLYFFFFLFGLCQADLNPLLLYICCLAGFCQLIYAQFGSVRNANPTCKCDDSQPSCQHCRVCLAWLCCAAVIHSFLPLIEGLPTLLLISKRGLFQVLIPCPRRLSLHFHPNISSFIVKPTAHRDFTLASSASSYSD